MATGNHKAIPELTERQRSNFLARVDKRGPNECWEWQGCRKKDGYGTVGMHPMGGFLVPRIASFIATGVDPGHLNVLHSCDNPPCANPLHLFTGTQVDNIRDMIEKGRAAFPDPEQHARGTQCQQTKFTEESLLFARQLRSEGLTYRDIKIRLRQEFSIEISHQSCRNAVRGISWSHMSTLIQDYPGPKRVSFYNAKLTTPAIIRIREMADSGFGRKAISEALISEFGISISLPRIHHIVHRNAYKHVA